MDEKMIYMYNNLTAGDMVETASLEGEWEVRYISHSEKWVEVSDEEDTVRHIIYWKDITKHTPFMEDIPLFEEE
jgi:hypothetical protein